MPQLVPDHPLFDNMEPALFGYSLIEEFEDFILNIDDATITRISIDGTNYHDLRRVIIDFTQVVGRTFYTLSYKVKNVDELIIFERQISRLSAISQRNPDFPSQLKCSLDHRMDLTNSLVRAADKLDKNSFLFAGIRLLGFAFGALNSLNLGGNLTELLFNTSPLLGISIQGLSIAAGQICLITSYGEHLWFKNIIEKIISDIEVDQNLYRPINDRVLENIDMQAIVAEIFSEWIANEDVRKIEEIIAERSICEKIFGTVLVANMKRNPECMKDKRFICKAFRFSRTLEGEEWYKRMLWSIHPEDLAKDAKLWKDQLLHLKMIKMTSCQSSEVLIFLLSPQHLPGYVMFGLHGGCLLYGIRKSMHSTKSLISTDLRLLALYSERFRLRMIT